jgi:hypothetical protein
MKRTPVQLSCPIKCLGLQETVLAPLRRGYPEVEPPQTVGDLVELARESQLILFRNIGQGRVKEIEESLRRAGFPIQHRHQVDDSEDHNH